MKCGNETCDLEIKNGRAMKCSECKKSFCFDNPANLNKCGGWTQKSWASKGSKQKATVRCIQCKNQEKSVTGDAKQDEESSEEEEMKETEGNKKEDIKLILKRMEKVLEDVRKDQKALHAAVDFVTKKYDEIYKEQQKSQEDIKALKKEVREVTQKLQEKEETIFNLQRRVIESETYVRNRNIELHGVVEDDQEDVEEIICKTAKALGVDIRREEIDAAHRVHSKNVTAPRPIVAQLTSRKKRDAILSQRKREVYNKEVNKQKKGEGRIYVSEQHPYILKELKWKAKKRGEEKGWRFVWIGDGKVLARKVVNSKAVRIESEKDLDLIK